MSKKTTETKTGNPTAKDAETPLSDEQLSEAQGGGPFTSLVTKVKQAADTASKAQKKFSDTANDIISNI